MAGSLGTIAGQVKLDIASAMAGFAALRVGATTTAGSMAAAGTKVSLFGKLALGAGVALVAAFAVAVNAAATFEKKMDYFGAVNNATAADMEKVRAKALELGRDGQFSANQIADAFVEMGKAGVSVKDITDGLAEAVINLASAADIKLTEATNILTSQLQTYHLGVDQAVHVTNELAGAANASIVDVSDLGTSFKYVGGVAYALGISFDSTTDALSILGKAGIRGSTAGTSLRQIMVSLAGGTDKAKDELKALGIITKDGANLFFDAHGKAKSLAEVFQILQDHTKGLTQQQQLMAFRTIFNNRALAAAEILTKSGAKGFAEMNDQISKTTAADVAAKRLDNLSGDIQKLKGSIDTMMIKAGTPFQAFLRTIVQSITGVINTFVRLPDSVQGSILGFIGITGAILVFVGTIALVGGTMLKMVKTFKEMYTAMKALWAITKILTIATWEQTIAALSNPYVLIAMAVIALVVGLIVLYNKSEKFQQIMDAIGRGIKTGFLATVEWFKTLPKFFSDLWKDIAGWFTTGVGWVKKNWDILLVIITGPLGLIILVIRRFGSQILDFFTAIPGQVTGFISRSFDAFLAFMQKLPYYLGFAIGFIIGSLVKFAIDSYNLLAKWGVDAYNATIAFFAALPGEVVKFFTDLYNNFVAWATNFLVSSTKWSIDTYNGIIHWFQLLPGRVTQFFINLWHSTVQVWNSFKAGAAQFAVDSYNGIIHFFALLPGRVSGFFSDMYHKAVTQFSNVVASSIKVGIDVYNAITGWFGKLPGAVWGIIGNVISAFESMVSSAFDVAKDFGQGLWDGFKHGIGMKSPSYIEKAMWQITKVTDTETKRLATQVRTMRSLAGDMTDKNPAKAAQAANTSRIVALTAGMKSQAQALKMAASTLFPMDTSTSLLAPTAPASGTASTPLTTGLGASPSERPITVTVYNPVAETAADSTARKLRTLAGMGAF